MLGRVVRNMSLWNCTRKSHMTGHEVEQSGSNLQGEVLRSVACQPAKGLKFCAVKSVKCKSTVKFPTWYYGRAW